MNNEKKYVGKLSGLLNNPKKELNNKQDKMKELTPEDVRNMMPSITKRIFSRICVYFNANNEEYDGDGNMTKFPDCIIEKGRYLIVSDNLWGDYDPETDTTTGAIIVDNELTCDISDLHIIKEFNITDDIPVAFRYNKDEDNLEIVDYEIFPIILYRDELEEYIDGCLFLLCIDENGKYKFDTDSTGWTVIDSTYTEEDLAYGNMISVNKIFIGTGIYEDGMEVQKIYDANVLTGVI